ncbi:atrial natriuretic peptide receptor 1-like [Musca vetustissima]|uniref:atrial natriuretic peptide receptor 1-like n=1 Tax=Musca vetustissima TaxID=27455 RepID=UPI002AB6CFF7|nr:atrial natriuretic peptide receptor 1-like [Musca vetustissima]
MHNKDISYYFCNKPCFRLVITACIVLSHLQITSPTIAPNIYNDNYEETGAEIYNYQCLPKRVDSLFASNTYGIGLQVTSWPSHQLISRIFALFLREVLNYENVYLFPVMFNGNPNDVNYEAMKLTHIMDLINNPKILMMNVGLWTPVGGHSVIPQNVHAAGTSMFPGRFGWFASPVHSNISGPSLDYSIFLNYTNPQYKQFVLDEGELRHLLQDSGSEYFQSRLCKEIRCAILLAENKNDTSFVQHQIEEMNAYLNIVWLGPRFRSELDRLNFRYRSDSDKRFLILHWTPSDIIYNARPAYEYITLPLCEDARSLYLSYCKYELTPVIKYYAKGVEKDERLMFALRYFWISVADMDYLYNELKEQRNFSHEGFEMYDKIACKWMQKQNFEKSTWILRKRKTLSVGGIFPILENSRGHQNLIQAVRRAANVINDSTIILPHYNFRVLENDGECKADIVMRTFIHYFNDPDVIGVLGPACSETVEPIAGISRHTNMAVISYSAEGASFLDREAYPFFFRTIGSNRQYEDLYISFMKEFGWKRVAAITEDGQKYTEYISHMETTLKNNNFELIANKKFLNDVNSQQMKKHLEDLKQRHARIIIADIHNKYAAMLLCEAFKLEMTAYQGYVWFLPSWLSKDLNSLVIEGNINCTIAELEKVFEGHFSITHLPFGNNDTMMQENITIKNWIDSYSSNVKDISQYTAFAYDAVWVYAKAVDTILSENNGVVDSFKSKQMVKRLVDIIWETDFHGLSGRVRFGEGGSRITDLIVTQWRKNQTFVVGKYTPKVIGSGRNLRTNGGDLNIGMARIVWLSDTKPPSDGTFDCTFSSLAKMMHVDCEKANVLFTTFVCMAAVIIVSTVSFLFWKRRYDRKLKESARIMKNFGIDLLSPSNSSANTLDKWEVPKENVVINRKLGDGAFGTVYGGEALIPAEGWTAVAVKTLKTGASTEDRLDFLSEAQAMKLFNHKNIVKLLGVCLQSEPIYTIMEFMLYGDLKTYLLARRHLVNEQISDDSDISSKRLTRYALDVAKGLAYLAQQKYVHRDIACRNCLVSAQRTVKIGDFGMARPTYESDYYRFNRKGMLPVRWMAPEALALGMFTPASDVWAFGVVLFEIITFASVPYQGLTNNQVLEYVKNGNTLQVPVGIKPQLEALINACWNRDPKKRPTASDIIEYISKYPSLLTACLDFPSASVEMPETECDEFELLSNVLRCSPPANDSDLDVVAQTSLADRFVATNNERNASQPINIGMDQINQAATSEQYASLTPTTPDGYSIMSPLLNQSTKTVIQEIQF